MSEFHDVGYFHEKFGLDNTTAFPAGPREENSELMGFRVRFMHEELKEFEDAYLVGDHAGMFDALIDLVYVAYGTAHFLGYPWVVGWQEVQMANLRKTRAKPDGSDSQRGSQYDVVKPPGWEPPHIADILREFGWDIP